MSTSQSLDDGEKPGRWDLAHVPHMYVLSLGGDLVQVTFRAAAQPGTELMERETVSLSDRILCTETAAIV